MTGESAQSNGVDAAHAYAARQDTVKNIAAAKLAHRMVDIILDRFVPGVLESDIKQQALEIFDQHGLDKVWHTPYVRFGCHSILTYNDEVKEDRRLEDGDIAFIDIGIVLDGIEGDAGRTIVLGNDPEKLAMQEASEAIFHAGRQFWREQNPSGVALYDFLHAEARSRGYRFVLDPAGHLIGEFPHRGWKSGINHFPDPVEAGAWIMEIHIAHATKPIGAFYENLIF